MSFEKNPEFWKNLVLFLLKKSLRFEKKNYRSENKTPNLKIIRFTIQISQNKQLGFYVPYGPPQYCMYLYGHAIKADVVDVFGSNLLTRLFRYFIICHNFWSFAVVLFSAARCPIQHFVGALVCLAILSKFLLPQRNKLLFFHLFIFIICFYTTTVQKQHIFLM